MSTEVPNCYCCENMDDEYVCILLPFLEFENMTGHQVKKLAAQCKSFVNSCDPTD